VYLLLLLLLITAKADFRYHEHHLVVIDVSQSVEHAHPNALEFLRKDCTNIIGMYIFYIITL